MLQAPVFIRETFPALVFQCADQSFQFTEKKKKREKERGNDDLAQSTGNLKVRRAA